MPAEPLPADIPEPIRAPVRVSRLPVFAALAQGFFAVVLGLWPVVNLPSFEAVAGKAPDHWSLITAALLFAAIGLSLFISAVRRDVTIEVFLLGLLTALSRAGADIFFYITAHLPAVHLLDAVAEMLFVALWCFALRDVRRKRHPISLDPPIFGQATEKRGP